MATTAVMALTTLAANATVDEGCGTWDELWLTCFTNFPLEIVVEVLVFGYCFVGLAIVCDDYLVQSLETLCARWNIREDVAGASFVAFGSAAPEIIINSITTIKSAGSDTGAGADLGVSAIIGSGMIAFLLIPGCCGVFSSKVLPLKRRPLLRDSLTYLAALIILCVFMSNGTVELYEGLVLTGAYILYILVVYLAPQVRFKYREAQAKKRGETIKRYESFVTKGNASAKKASTYGELADGEDTVELEDGARDRSSSQGLLGSSHMSDFATDDDDADASLLADMGDFDDGPGLDMAMSDALPTPGDIAAVGDDNFVDPAKVCCQCLITGTVRNVNRSRAAGCTCFLKWVVTCLLFPLRVLFKYTCPPCELETKWERMYPLTFFVSFIWVAVFSFVISTVVDRWVGFAPATANYLSVIFGVILVAGGAEIPDTLQSVLYARQGYGSMAVSNCIGSQICNILLGLGLPWTISNIIGTPVRINNYPQIQAAAWFQFANVILNFCLLVGVAFATKKDKAMLGRGKGVFLCVMYLLVVGAFCTYTVLAPATNSTAADGFATTMGPVS